jgi:hypothetical protein
MGPQTRGLDPKVLKDLVVPPSGGWDSFFVDPYAMVVVCTGVPLVEATTSHVGWLE